MEKKGWFKDWGKNNTKIENKEKILPEVDYAIEQLIKRDEDYYKVKEENAHLERENYLLKNKEENDLLLGKIDRIFKEDAQRYEELYRKKPIIDIIISRNEKELKRLKQYTGEGKFEYFSYAKNKNTKHVAYDKKQVQKAIKFMIEYLEHFYKVRLSYEKEMEELWQEVNKIYVFKKRRN